MPSVLFMHQQRVFYLWNSLSPGEWIDTYHFRFHKRAELTNINCRIDGHPIANRYFSEMCKAKKLAAGVWVTSCARDFLVLNHRKEERHMLTWRHTPPPHSSRGRFVECEIMLCWSMGIFCRRNCHWFDASFGDFFGIIQSPSGRVFGCQRDGHCSFHRLSLDWFYL